MPLVAFLFIRKVFLPTARLALLPFALLMEQALRCQLGFSISNQVLPSQNRTERPRFRNHAFCHELAVTQTRR
jgi:hypothetical protein